MRKDCERILGLVERYFDGELSGRQAGLVEDHLTDCPKCAAELRTLHNLRGLVQSSLREAAMQVELADLWRHIEPRIQDQKTSLWERLGVAVREYFSAYKPVFATAGVAALAAVIVIPLALRDSGMTEGTRPQSNECIIESIESSGSTAMVFELSEDQTKVIWMIEEVEDEGEGPSAL
jgi:anti-sigma factor RsiW